MYRIEAVVIVFAVLPLLMAIVLRATVIPGRKHNMVAAIYSAQLPSAGLLGQAEEPPEVRQYIGAGKDRVERDFDSLYSTRLLFPAVIVSFLYLIGLTLGVSLFTRPACHAFLCRPFNCFDLSFLINPVAAVVGAYVFNMGVLVRRSYMADVTKNVYWGSINRLVFSIGIAFALYPLLGKQSVVCFAIAFFPKVFITLLRKQTTKVLSIAGATTVELDIQLVQGIDVWKEERLEEEGIESVQNLATADVLGLAVKMHYPLRTIVDWIDQAIFIQRFPKVFQAVQDAGFSISAIEFAWIGTQPNQELLALLSQKTSIEISVLQNAMQSLSEDAGVRVLWRLWQHDSVA